MATAASPALGVDPAPRLAAVTPLPLAPRHVDAPAATRSVEDERASAVVAARAEAIALAAKLRRERLRAFALAIIPPIAGLALFVAIWAALANAPDSRLPGPEKTWNAAVELFGKPFYRNGPNDQGVGWNILSSLQRVGLGFGLAALIGIPAGFVIGRFAFLSRMAAPIISLLRPVSPLAWLPIGLLVFKAAHPAAIWVIFISAIWPMIINTAAGVRAVPADYLNVARVLNLSEWRVATRILLPAALPHVLTGIRLSVGVAWLVIVAAEMLTGGIGIGFWVWDEWNNLNVEHIIIAIFIVGTVGLLLEQAILVIARRVTHGL